MERIRVPEQDFNPRSREGSDRGQGNKIFQRRNFNPRSREGSDGNIFGLADKFIISIHAPAKGATI